MVGNSWCHEIVLLTWNSLPTGLPSDANICALMSKPFEYPFDKLASVQLITNPPPASPVTAGAVTLDKVTLLTRNSPPTGLPSDANICALTS